MVDNRFSASQSAARALSALSTPASTTPQALAEVEELLLAALAEVRAARQGVEASASVTAVAAVATAAASAAATMAATAADTAAAIAAGTVAQEPQRPELAAATSEVADGAASSPRTRRPTLRRSPSPPQPQLEQQASSPPTPPQAEQQASPEQPVRPPRSAESPPARPVVASAVSGASLREDQTDGQTDGQTNGQADGQADLRCSSVPTATPTPASAAGPVGAMAKVSSGSGALPEDGEAPQKDGGEELRAPERATSCTAAAAPSVGAAQAASRRPQPPGSLPSSSAAASSRRRSSAACARPLSPQPAACSASVATDEQQQACAQAASSKRANPVAMLARSLQRGLRDPLGLIGHFEQLQERDCGAAPRTLARPRPASLAQGGTAAAENALRASVDTGVLARRSVHGAGAVTTLPAFGSTRQEVEVALARGKAKLAAQRGRQQQLLLPAGTTTSVQLIGGAAPNLIMRT